MLLDDFLKDIFIEENYFLSSYKILFQEIVLLEKLCVHESPNGSSLALEKYIQTE